MFPREGLTHEQNIALDVLERNLPLFSPNVMVYIENLTIKMVSTQGNAFFFDKHIITPQIPRESHWKWNQSRRKIELQDSLNIYNITFCKLNSRVIPPATIAPNLKIWIFNIIYIAESRKYGFFWCQKGIEYEYLDEDFLKELSFLKRFVSDDIAYQLGWTESANHSFHKY